MEVLVVCKVGWVSNHGSGSFFVLRWSRTPLADLDLWGKGFDDDDGVDDMAAFRSISLMGSLCKIIAKVLASKMKEVVENIIST